MSMFVHMGGVGSKPLSMWIMIPTFYEIIIDVHGSEVCNALPGGAEQCCLSKILESGKICSNGFETGCVLPGM